MAERKMLRQVMSPSDIYAHAEAVCDMLREHYGSYDADSLEEVIVDDAFAQRLQSRGYDLLGEGEVPEAAPVPGRRDTPRADNVAPTNTTRRPTGDRVVPMRRSGSGDSVVPMRRRDSSNDGGVPLRRADRNDNGMQQRRRDNAPQNDGMNQGRRRDTTQQSDGVPMRRRDARPSGDMIPSPPPLDAPSPRRSWDTAREDATVVPPRREQVAPQPSFAEPADARVQPATSAQELPAPIVEAPVQSMPSTAEVQTSEASMVEAPPAEAPAAKPVPRTRRTARARTKVDPDTAS